MVPDAIILGSYLLFSGVTTLVIDDQVSIMHVWCMLADLSYLIFRKLFKVSGFTSWWCGLLLSAQSSDSSCVCLLLDAGPS